MMSGGQRAACVAVFLGFQVSAVIALLAGNGLAAAIWSVFGVMSALMAVANGKR